MKLHERFRQVYRYMYPMRDFQPFSFAEREMVMLAAMEVELDSLRRSVAELRSQISRIKSKKEVA